MDFGAAHGGHVTLRKVMRSPPVDFSKVGFGSLAAAHASNMRWMPLP